MSDREREIKIEGIKWERKKTVKKCTKKFVCQRERERERKR